MRADRQYVRARADTKMVISDHGAEVRSLRFVHTYRVFLSDPSPIIAMHWPPSLTHSWKADLTDVTLAFEDNNSKFLDVVSFGQGGRSCAGARVAPAEKFGLGRKF